MRPSIAVDHPSLTPQALRPLLGIDVIVRTPATL